MVDKSSETKKQKRHSPFKQMTINGYVKVIFHSVKRSITLTCITFDKLHSHHTSLVIIIHLTSMSIDMSSD